MIYDIDSWDSTLYIQQEIRFPRYDPHVNTSKIKSRNTIKQKKTNIIPTLQSQLHHIGSQNSIMTEKYTTKTLLNFFIPMSANRNSK